jgi:hypothetical protein
MRRRAWLRFASALLGAWFAVASSDPAALHACAMLGASPVQMRMPGMPAGGDGGHHQPQQPTGTQQCCIGPCVCATAVLAPASLGDLVAVELLTPGRRVLPSTRLLFQPALVAHARPPSLGPPAPAI